MDAFVNLISTFAEEKRYRKLQYDAEWEQSANSVFYKNRADYFKKLFLNGVVYEPKF